MAKIQIALATNMNYLRLALVAMGSVIEKATRPVTVHFLADSLTNAAKDLVEVACAQVPGTELVWHDVSDILPMDYDESSWPRVVFARLHLPEVVKGRILYIDSDTMTFSDVCPLFDLDLGDNLIAAVRDFGLLNFLLRLKHEPHRLEMKSQLVSPYPVHDYFNSGIVLMNCDRIRRDRAIFSAITNMDLAARHDSDQDHLNHWFRGKTLLLDPAWNSFYGRIRHNVRIAKATLPENLVHSATKPRIVHFVYDPRPWASIEPAQWTRTSFLLRILPMLVRYRLNAARLLRPVRRAARAMGQQDLLARPAEAAAS